VNTVTVCRW